MEKYSFFWLIFGTILPKNNAKKDKKMWRIRRRCDTIITLYIGDCSINMVGDEQEEQLDVDEFGLIKDLLIFQEFMEESYVRLYWN